MTTEIQGFMGREGEAVDRGQGRWVYVEWFVWSLCVCTFFFLLTRMAGRPSRFRTQLHTYTHTQDTYRIRQAGTQLASDSH